MTSRYIGVIITSCAHWDTYINAMFCTKILGSRLTLNTSRICESPSVPFLCWKTTSKNGVTCERWYLIWDKIDMHCEDCAGKLTQRTYDAKITSKDVVTYFWRNDNAVIVSRARWESINPVDMSRSHYYVKKTLFRRNNGEHVITTCVHGEGVHCMLFDYQRLLVYSETNRKIDDRAVFR